MEIVKKNYKIIIGIIVFVVYLFTLAPGVVQIDAGELAAVQLTLGIAHPTGYPLFTVLGFLYSLLPLPFTDIFSLNMLAAIYTSVGLFFFMLFSENIFEIISVNAKKKYDKFEMLLSVSAAAFILAFSKTFWLQSTSVEVYSLQILLFNLLLWNLSKNYLAIINKKGPNWLLTAVILAFSFANHMTTLLLLPGIAYLFFRHEGYSKKAWIIIFKMLVVFFPLLIALYSYLPLRASANPLINWGNPVNWENFWRHFTGKQYQVWLFASLDSAEKQLAYFINNLGGEFAYIALLQTFMGIIYLYKRNKTILTFISINFLFTVLYSINYDINDIDSYFLLAYISLAAFAGFGVLYLYNLLHNKSVITVLIIGSVVLAEFGFNLPKTNQSDMHAIDDYTQVVLSGAPENSIIFTYQWDYLVSPSYYYQLAEGKRNDIIIIDKELLRRSWYYNQLNTNYPGLLKGLDEEVNLFLKALAPFERGEPFNAALLEKLYRQIMTDLISANVGNHNYFIAPELVDNEMRRKELTLPQGLFIIPDIFFYRVVPDNNYHPAVFPDYKIRFPEKDNAYTLQLKNILAGMLIRRAFYELNYGKTEQAKTLVNKVRTEFPLFRIPVKLRNL